MELLRHFWANLQAGALPDLGIWSYVFLAVLVAVEGPAATLLGAAAAAAGMMNPAPAFAASAAGNLMADAFWYTLGYTGRIEWFARRGARFGVTPEHLMRLTAGMHRHAVKILVFAKLTSALMIPSLISAGLARVSWRRWLPALVPAEMLWSGSLFLVGYYATHAIRRVEQGLEFFAVAVTVTVILVILVLLRRRWGRNAAAVGLEDEGESTE